MGDINKRNFTFKTVISDIKLYISSIGGKQRKLLLGLNNLYWIIITYIRHRCGGDARGCLRHPPAGASCGIERHEGEQAGGRRACEITEMRTEY